MQEFSHEHRREFRGITPEAMQALVDYSWPGNVRELRNLVESMVVLSHGKEIGLEDIPRAIREELATGAVPAGDVGPLVREGERAGGRELEFIVRSLVELKLQVEELRRRTEQLAGAGGSVAGAAVAQVLPPQTHAVLGRGRGPPASASVVARWCARGLRLRVHRRRQSRGSASGDDDGGDRAGGDRGRAEGDAR